MVQVFFSKTKNSTDNTKQDKDKHEQAHIQNALTPIHTTRKDPELLCGAMAYFLQKEKAKISK